MNIPLSAPDLTEPEISAVAETLRSPTLSLGPRLAEFEAAFTQLTGVAHAIGVSSGTAGLHLALHALGIGPGDEVIVPSFTFIAVANTVRYMQATPVFADIDPATLNLSPAAVEAAITAHTRAIVLVHTFGLPADISALQTLAQRHNLFLVEDACEAIGAEVDGRPIGSLGDIAVFAFYPNKQITTGEGGMVVTADPALAARVRALRNQGRYPTDGWLQHTELGFNYRLSEVAATLGIGQMRRLPEILARRAEVGRLYHQHLAPLPGLILPAQSVPDAQLSWFVYVVQLAPRYTAADRDRILAELNAQGIGCARYFAPIHLQPAYAAWNALSLPVTESVAARTIALPFFNRIQTHEIAAVAHVLEAALRHITEVALTTDTAQGLSS